MEHLLPMLVHNPLPPAASALHPAGSSAEPSSSSSSSSSLGAAKAELASQPSTRTVAGMVGNELRGAPQKTSRSRKSNHTLRPPQYFTAAGSDTARARRRASWAPGVTAKSTLFTPRPPPAAKLPARPKPAKAPASATAPDDQRTLPPLVKQIAPAASRTSGDDVSSSSPVDMDVVPSAAGSPSCPAPAPQGGSVGGAALGNNDDNEQRPAKRSRGLGARVTSSAGIGPLFETSPSGLVEHVKLPCPVVCSALAVTPGQGSYVATGSNAVRVYATAALMATHAGGDATPEPFAVVTPAAVTFVRTLAWAPNSEWLAIGGEGAADVTLWAPALASGSGVERPSSTLLRGHSDDVYSAAWAPNSRTLLTSSKDGSVCVWRPQAVEQTDVNDTTGPVAQWAVSTELGAEPVAVTSVDISPDGAFAVTSTVRQALHVHDLSTGRIVSSFTGHSDTVNKAAWSLSGRCFMSSSADGTVKIWDARAPAAPIATCAGPAAGVFCAQLTGATGVLAGGADGGVYAWDTRTPSRPLGILRTSTRAAVFSIAAGPALADSTPLSSPYTMALITGSNDESARVWSLDVASDMAAFLPTL
ncbi:transcriptional repressor rco-1 [Thecamonas trahens ATCC 50062]|uniref:Transcriptional repressor rco-1 n=1 Tax=Thecamonas trahens ATCC 50062 TaxID=461836 RepID=A0A0L0D5R3_THETB|nr:transcriptional repressor rco-1 [Thecamonas trahens ATCC 50062]KNC47545.1 transcriptional repressor rco-1 [Thecamonas trahens ATCC 50062]|eukprot:XP_013759477.1 transcriptional repressor rco-1 [Thecamonas trahens ATCC 50062]